MTRELCCFAAGLLAGGLLLAGCGRKSTPPASAVPPQNPLGAGAPVVDTGAAPHAIAQQPLSPPEVEQPGVPRPANPRRSAASQTADGRPARPVPARPRDERPAPQDEVPLIRELRRSLAEADVESDNDRKSVSAMFDEAEPQLRRVLGKNSLRAIQQANQRAPYLVIEPPRKPATKPTTDGSSPAPVSPPPSSPTPRPAPKASAGE